MRDSLLTLLGPFNPGRHGANPTPSFVKPVISPYGLNWFHLSLFHWQLRMLSNSAAKIYKEGKKAPSPFGPGRTPRPSAFPALLAACPTLLAVPHTPRPPETVSTRWLGEGWPRLSCEPFLDTLEGKRTIHWP